MVDGTAPVLCVAAAASIPHTLTHKRESVTHTHTSICAFTESTQHLNLAPEAQSAHVGGRGFISSF